MNTKTKGVKNETKTNEKWLDILNDVSVVLEYYIMTEEDKKRIRDLDSVIDEIYTELDKKTKTKGK